MQRTSEQEWKVKNKEVLKLVRKKKEPGEKFRENINSVFLSAEDDLEIVENLARRLRSYESGRNRLEGYIKYLREKLRSLIRDLDIKEHIFARTHIKRIDVWSIPDGKKGGDLSKIY